MLLTKDELIASLRNEVRLLLHLASKAEPSMLDYRPSAGQRSMLELLKYLAIMGPIHFRGTLAESFDIDAWRSAWEKGHAAAKEMDLEAAKEAIAVQPALYEDLLGACSDEELRAGLEMFGSKMSRGAWIVSLVLCHYSAYRMQLFLYLKASGLTELNTMNLWAGVDAPMPG